MTAAINQCKSAEYFDQTGFRRLYHFLPLGRQFGAGGVLGLCVLCRALRLAGANQGDGPDLAQVGCSQCDGLNLALQGDIFQRPSRVRLCVHRIACQLGWSSLRETGVAEVGKVFEDGAEFRA